MASAHHIFSSATIGIPFLSWDVLTATAVQSVINQTVQDWELILLFDGPAHLAPALPDVIASDPRISLVANNRQMGLSYSLNRIAQLAQTKFLFRMDADDVMHPDRVAITMRHLSQNDIDVLGTCAYAISSSGALLGAYREGPLPSTERGFFRSNALSHPTVAGRTAWFKENPYDESIQRAEDKELWLRTCTTARMAKLPDRTLYYRLPEAPDRRKVEATHRDNLHLLWRHPGLRGHQRGWEIARASMKHTAQDAMIRVGLGRRVQARKVSRLTDDRHEAALQALTQATTGAPN